MIQTRSSLWRGEGLSGNGRDQGNKWKTKLNIFPFFCCCECLLSKQERVWVYPVFVGRIYVLEISDFMMFTFQVSYNSSFYWIMTEPSSDWIRRAGKMEDDGKCESARSQDRTSNYFVIHEKQKLTSSEKTLDIYLWVLILALYCTFHYQIDVCCCRNALIWSTYPTISSLIRSRTEILHYVHYNTTSHNPPIVCHLLDFTLSHVDI